MKKGIHTGKKLRFLFIAMDKFPPFRVDVSILFGKKIAGKGHHIDWLMQSDRDCPHAFVTNWLGSRVFVAPTDNGNSILHRFRKHLLDFKNDLKLLSLMSKEKYDFIQVKDKYLVAVITIIASKLFKTRFIFWLSYPFPEVWLYKVDEGTARYTFIYWIRGVICKFLQYKLIMPLADHVFVQSEQMKKDVIKMGISEKKITPVPMGVDIESVPLVNSKVSGENNKIVLYLGIMIKVRRIDFLIRAFHKVLKKVPDAKLYMVGDSDDPGDLQYLKKVAKELDIDGAVIFKGFIPQEKAWKLVRKATVCVSPFYPTAILNSTSPTKLIEYMAMGKPVVGNNHPEQSLVISESGAGICVPYEEEAFAEAIVELLTDIARAKKLGRLGQKYVEEKRSYDRIAELVEMRYRNICRKS